MLPIFLLLWDPILAEILTSCLGEPVLIFQRAIWITSNTAVNDRITWFDMHNASFWLPFISGAGFFSSLSLISAPPSPVLAFPYKTFPYTLRSNQWLNDLLWEPAEGTSQDRHYDWETWTVTSQSPGYFTFFPTGSVLNAGTPPHLSTVLPIIFWDEDGVLPEYLWSPSEKRGHVSAIWCYWFPCAHG